MCFAGSNLVGFRGLELGAVGAGNSENELETPCGSVVAEGAMILGLLFSRNRFGLTQEIVVIGDQNMSPKNHDLPLALLDDD